jgi:hypothetical protein
MPLKNVSINLETFFEILKVEQMTSDTEIIKIKFEENIKIGDLEISFDRYLEAREMDPNGNTGMLLVFSLTLKKEGKSKKIDFSFHPELENPVETRDGYQISFLNGSSYEIELKIEKETF